MGKVKEGRERKRRKREGKKTHKKV